MSVLGWLLLSAGLVLVGHPRPDRARHQQIRPRRHLPLPLIGGVLASTVSVLLGGRTGEFIALPGAIAVYLVVRKMIDNNAAPKRDPRLVAFLLDLLACCLAAGAPPERALASVSDAVQTAGTDQLRMVVEPLRLVGRLLLLGTDPVQAWAVVDTVPGFAAAAAAGRRCANSGARLASGLAEAAAELRAQYRSDQIARAERTGIWALLPLGCCFLPAFVCIGVLPVVVGVADQVFAGR